MTALELYARCVLPGCDLPSEHPGVPCGQCVVDFGDMLRATDRQPMSAEQVAQRDAEQRDAIRRQLEWQAASERRAAQDAGEVKKPGQTCWMCEERRSCTRTRQGWECDDCREIR